MNAARYPVASSRSALLMRFENDDTIVGGALAKVPIGKGPDPDSWVTGYTASKANQGGFAVNPVKKVALAIPSLIESIVKIFHWIQSCPNRVVALILSGMVAGVLLVESDILAFLL